MSEPGALYRGTVTHRRVRPREHAFRYRAFWVLLDLDQLEGSATRLFSVGRFNLLSFEPCDHGDGSGRDLKAQAMERLAEAGLDAGVKTVRLLALPRVLGFVFNPISVYYGEDAAGQLTAVIYEVTSTFGERRSYVLPAHGATPFRQSCGKALHVSPFLEMAMTYDFRGRAPDALLTLSIDGRDADGLLIATGVRARRRALTDAEVLKAVLAVPLETLKVVAAIHWEALRLWLKGVPTVRAPARG